MDFANPNTAPKQKIQIFISCRKLKDLDTFSKSDPICHVLLSDNQMNSFYKIGETEVKDNNLNPDFSTSFVIDYYFEKVQHIRFDVFDKDPTCLEFIGTCVATVGKIAGARNQTFISQLKDQKNKKTGNIIIRAQNVKSTNDQVAFKLSAKKIDNVDGWFDKSDPYLVFSRARQNNIDGSSMEWVRTHQSEVIMDNLNPSWRAFTVSLQTICNSDRNLPIRIEIWDWEKSGKNKYICGTTTSLQNLIELSGGGTIEMVNEKKAEKKKKKYKNSGVLNILQCNVIQKPSFIQYLRSGWGISLSVAIDFTASNGDAVDPNSLHYIGGMSTGQLNSYQNAILQVGQIVEEYDFDKRFPVWGFGGIPRYQGATAVSHCFNLTPDGSEVAGTRGVLDIYRYAIQNTGLYGPTFFSGILKAMLSQLQKSKGVAMYNILLIITDGEIMDMPETKKLIVQLSALPLSIIIIGVGSASFSKMEQLDSDKNLLKDSSGKQALRDIVQFVEFNKLKHSPTALSEEVLKEVPDQFVKFMSINNIMPKKTAQLIPKGTIPPEMLNQFVPPPMMPDPGLSAGPVPPGGFPGMGIGGPGAPSQGPPMSGAGGAGGGGYIPPPTF